VFFATLVAIIISVLAIRSSRNAKMVPKGLQNFMEVIVEGLDNFFSGILGKDARQFTPFLGTLFIYIWCMNMFGLIPGFMSPTGGLRGGFNITLSLAICVFVYVQWTGLRRLGIGGYLHHMAGSPHSLVQWVLVPLNLPIHIIGELAKPLSLSLRLLGNITGEDMLIAAFAVLGITAISFLELPIGLPLHLPFIFLALLTGTIQALVFTLLSSIYFSMMLPHEEH
jgi:F-type H+-transporting ATPase subunit a